MKKERMHLLKMKNIISQILMKLKDQTSLQLE